MSYSTRFWLGCIFVILCSISVVFAADPLLHESAPLLIPDRPTLNTPVSPPITIPYQDLNEDNTIIICADSVQNDEYVDHIVTVVNEHATDTVWINLFAGPFGRFPSGTECQVTQCDGNTCCPSVSCPNAKCGSTPCNTGAVPLPYNGGFVLGPGESKNITVQVTKDRITTGSGGLQVWARTGCKPTGYPDYPLICDTANCDLDYAPHSKVECGGVGSKVPATKAEITFNGNYGLDGYDISLVDGWNVPMWLEPISGNYDRTNNPYTCTCSGGYRDLVALAETELPLMVYRADGNAVAVWSACKYSAYVDPKVQNESYCCIGAYADPVKCQNNAKNWLKDYQTATFFEKYYPKAYAFAYGDATGGYFTCAPDDGDPIDYKLTIYGHNRTSASFEAKSKINLTVGEPATIVHPEPGITIELVSGLGGMHVVHVSVIPSDAPPEYPDEYCVSIPTLREIYHIQSTIPEEVLDRFHVTVTYDKEECLNAGFIEETLRIYQFDKKDKIWKELDGKVDTENNRISGYSDGFGYFTMSGELSDPNSEMIRLMPGWNSISPAKRLAPGNNTASIFSGVDTAGHSIMKYSSETGWISLKSSDALSPLEGLWIYSVAAINVPVQFDPYPVQVPPVVSLGKGWNCIGFSGTISYSARDTLLSVQDLWRYCVPFDEFRQQYGTIIMNGGTGEYSDNRMLLPYHGYWVYMTGEGELAGLSYQP